MRPLRSFLLLLIFLACFTGLHYIIPANHLFPSIYEFIPAELITDLFSDNKRVLINLKLPADSVKIKSVADTRQQFDSVPVLSENRSAGSFAEDFLIHSDFPKGR